MMTTSLADAAVILTLVRSVEERASARMLIDGIRAFGGALRHRPIWLFEAHPAEAPCKRLAGEGVRILPLDMPATLPPYFFADKVVACAQAEAMTHSASEKIQSLIWIDPVCLIVNPPLLLALGADADAAVRPVHIKNVGLPPSAPLDDFWAGVYEQVGVEDEEIETTVETFVGAQRIRAYFNSHTFAIRPAVGLLSRWLDDFEALVGDEDYQARACEDQLHQVFLHQAILSALLTTQIEPQRLRLLPPTYSYPYNLHASVPPARRAETLNELVCMAYETRSVDPDVVDDIEIAEPLRSWLANYV